MSASFHDASPLVGMSRTPLLMSNRKRRLLQFLIAAPLLAVVVVDVRAGKYFAAGTVAIFGMLMLLGLGGSRPAGDPTGAPTGTRGSTPESSPESGPTA